MMATLGKVTCFIYKLLFVPRTSEISDVQRTYKIVYNLMYFNTSN